MRISHKRKVQSKLRKNKPFANTVAAVTEKPSAKVASSTKAPTVDVEVKAKVKPEPVVAPATNVSLTPKQQQVFDIVVSHAEGLNPKGIGLEAGQEDAKAASWATGALKKLTEEGLVERIQLAGNKVLYKAL